MEEETLSTDEEKEIFPSQNRKRNIHLAYANGNSSDVENKRKKQKKTKKPIIVDDDIDSLSE